MESRAIPSSCTLCREKHLKCDRKHPVCNNCSKTNKRCRPAPTFQFKQVDSFHPQTTKRRKRRRQDRHHEANDTISTSNWPTVDVILTETSTQASPSSLTPRAQRQLSNGEEDVTEANTTSTPHESPGFVPRAASNSPENVHSSTLQDGVLFNEAAETTVPLPNDIASSPNLSLPLASSRYADIGHGTTQGVTASSETTTLGNVDDGFNFGRLETNSVVEDYVSPSGDILYQNPPAIFGLPLTATIATHHTVNPPSEINTGVHKDSFLTPQGPQVRFPLPSIDLDGSTAPQTDGNNGGDNGSHTARPSHNAYIRTESFGAIYPPFTPLEYREAHLVKFFMQTFGPLLDCNDPDRHFALTVPQLALKKAPCLLSAILTISALQLSRISDYPSSAAKQYRRQCGRLLIPVLEDLTNREMEGAIFTTYVLLRVYDQMTVELRERPPDTLFSSSLALSTSPWSAYMDKEGSLKRAAFWVHIREDIHVALFLQWPIKIDCLLFQQNLKAIKDLTTADQAERRASLEQPGLHPPRPHIECAWSNHIIGLTCHVINYCFGPEQGKTVEAWASLLAQVECWNLEKPDTFAPFHEQDADTDRKQIFPRILLSCDWHVIGLMYYHLALILLKSHKPGQAGNLTTLHGKKEIIIHTRTLCGIVIFNPIAQALIIACHMINVAGVFLESPTEQREVLQLLHMARISTGWPVNEVEKRLQEAWALSRKL